MPQYSMMSFCSVSQSLGDSFLCEFSCVDSDLSGGTQSSLNLFCFLLFLILLVADPSFPLYLIVSCGKFLEFSGFFFVGVKNILTFPKG